MPRPKQYKIFIVNIKLRSRTRKGKEAYVDILKTLWESKISAPITEQDEMYLRTQFTWGQEQILYGTMTKYLHLSKRDWIDKQKGERGEHDVPPDYGALPKDTKYFFIPEAHRFCFIPTADFTIKHVESFLKYSVRQAIGMSEEVDIIVQQNKDTFNEIFSANRLLRLSVHLSYSNNDDFTKDLEKQIDDEMRNSQISALNLEAKAELGEAIILENTALLSTALKLAESGQGTAEATIIDSKGNRKTIKTEEKAERYDLDDDTNEDNLIQKIYNKVMAIFRNSDE